MEYNILALILTALATGATEGAKETATAAVKDTYSRLKTLLQQRLEDTPKAQALLEDYEEDPETYEKPLTKALLEAHVDQDREVLEVAKYLMTFIQPQQAGMGKYNVQITGNVQGYAQGDQQQVTMHFGSESKE